MTQWHGIGGGMLSDDGKEYVTWTVVVCPHCKRKVKEHYEAKELSEKEAEVYLNLLKNKNNDEHKETKQDAF